MKFEICDRNKKTCACVCVQHQQGQKRRKPNYSSVDLSEVEWEDKDDFVRYTHTFKHTHYCNTHTTVIHTHTIAQSDTQYILTSKNI